MSKFKGLKLCKDCEHYIEHETKNNGIVRAVCDKYTLRTEIKKGHTLFCIHSDVICPVCGYGLKLIKSDTGNYSKCKMCGYERAEAKL